MQLSVPFYAQEEVTTEPEWKRRSCGVTALCMVCAYYRGARDPSVPSVDALIAEGVHIGGYGPDGWEHDALVRLARNHGFAAYHEEWRSNTVDVATGTARESAYAPALAEAGLSKLRATVRDGMPVMVSVAPGFSGNEDSHVIVLVGVQEAGGGEEGGFYCHDPEARTASEGKGRFVPDARFREYWRRLAIFVAPREGGARCGRYVHYAA